MIRLGILIYLLLLFAHTAATAQSNEPKLAKLSEHFSKENGFDIISGEVKNITQQKLTNVQVVTTLYDRNHSVIKISDALIEYNPILPGQTSPYRTITTDNPAITTEVTTFKFLLGGKIETTLATHNSSSKGSRTSQTDHEELAYEANARQSLPATQQYRIALMKRGYIGRYIRSVETDADSSNNGKVSVTVTPAFSQLPNSQRLYLRREIEKIWIDVYRSKDTPYAEVVAASSEPASEGTSNPVREDREYRTAIAKRGYLSRYVRSVEPVEEEGIERIIVTPAFKRLSKDKQLSIQREVRKLWIDIYNGSNFPCVSA